MRVIVSLEVIFFIINYKVSFSFPFHFLWMQCSLILIVELMFVSVLNPLFSIIVYLFTWHLAQSLPFRQHHLLRVCFFFLATWTFFLSLNKWIYLFSFIIVFGFNFAILDFLFLLTFLEIAWFLDFRGIIERILYSSSLLLIMIITIILKNKHVNMCMHIYMFFMFLIYILYTWVYHIYMCVCCTLVCVLHH